MLVAGQEMSHKVQGRSGRIHKEEFLLSRRMAGAGDARKLCETLPAPSFSFVRHSFVAAAIALPALRSFADDAPASLAPPPRRDKDWRRSVP
jgi:hypothetical protein